MKTFLKTGVYIYRGYYTVARRYEFYFRVAKQYFTHSLRSFVKYCFCHEKIKFISSSRRVMFFLLYRQKDIDKVIEGNDRNYVIDKLTFACYCPTCEKNLVQRQIFFSSGSLFQFVNKKIMHEYCLQFP